MIIGVTGYKASGKDTLVNFFEEKGFKHISLSDYLRKILQSKGLDVTRENLTKLGSRLREEKGDNYLASLALKEFENSSEKIIISSIGRVAEIKELKKIPGFKLIFVDADEKIRFQRASKRQRESEHSSFEEFLKHDLIERTGGNGKFREFDNCKKESDIIISNNDSFESFKANSKKLLLSLIQ
ncbi:MAG: AAA family ATPase [Candidatus Woesearchaeota archaeon]